MRRVAILQIVCVVVIVTTVLTVQADDKPVPTKKFTYMSGSKASGGGDGTSHGLAADVLVCEQKPLRPIAWFGAFKPSDGKSQYLYILIFNTPADFDGSNHLVVSVNASSSSDTGAKGSMAVEMTKKKFEVTYKFPTDPKTHAVLKQSLTVGGQEVKEGDPRVFVVDLTGEKVTYTPVKVELPKDVPDVSQEKSEEWGAVVQRAVEQLKKDSPELKKLLDTKK
jgi:hypothetical protein